MRAIVHIGTEKTGTSSIQLFLYKNRKKLLRYGYHFLQSAGQTNNWALPAYCTVESRFDDFYRMHAIENEEELEAFKKRFVQSFEAEIRALDRNVHTVVISSEHFHSRLRTDEEMQNVSRFLSRYFSEIKVVCYLREQGATCASWYSTSMKSGGTDSFFDFVRRCRPDNYYFNYMDLLSKWEACFGTDALEVALFDRERFLNGSLLDDFTSRLDPALVGNLNTHVQAANESLNPAGQALARAINMAIPAHSDATEVGDMRDWLKEIVARRLSGRGQQLTPDMRRAVYESFVDSNEQVRKKFFPGLAHLFARPADDIQTDGVVGEPVFAVLSELFRELSRGWRSGRTDDYERFWAAISTCIGDAVAIRQGLGKPDTQVVLTEADGRRLNSAANKVEGLDLDLAHMLRGLAVQADPRIPGIRSKLEQYEEKRSEGPKRNFIMTYHGGSAPPDEEEGRRLDLWFSQWCHALDLVMGAPFNLLINKRTTVSSDQSEAREEPHFRAFTIFKAKSMEEAVAIAQTCPHLTFGGWVEVVQLENLADF